MIRFDIRKTRYVVPIAVNMFVNNAVDMILMMEFNRNLGWGQNNET